VLRLSVEDVLLPTLTTWGWPITKSRIQLQREVFSPRVLSLLMSFEGTMVLNAELECNRDCIICGSLRAVCKLEWV
jgi:hypothetical protein